MPREGAGALILRFVAGERGTYSEYAFVIGFISEVSQREPICRILRLRFHGRTGSGLCALVPRGQTCWRLGLARVGAQRPDYRWRLGLVRWCPEARHAGGWGLRVWVPRGQTRWRLGLACVGAQRPNLRHCHDIWASVHLGLDSSRFSGGAAPPRSIHHGFRHPSTPLSTPLHPKP